MAMAISPPSLYVAFGNNAKLFLKMVAYYEETFGVTRGRAWRGNRT
ncbi:hypothetical protein ALQ29_02985 [Pseudomonas marginalis pv. marginalis]|uniref:Uncharacterized protein n=1 Tax=Pseudomonas marginalis pv. marginalis TaxID=97473 RepID=A0A3M4AKI1_PSEMA|nr:hypothetical protein [Pseudomonas marginalis]RMP07431.1 hypothetical protein ALQ29_02985 [Pseudomonas marginalis pv. marginalis]